MSSLTRFWRGIESLPTLAAVEAEWSLLVGGEYNLIKPFLLAGKDRADSQLNPNGGFPLCAGRENAIRRSMAFTTDRLTPRRSNAGGPSTRPPTSVLPQRA